MLTPEQKANLVVVLAGARNPLNIGAAARAMSNFGFRTLRIVTEFPLPVTEAKSAVDAAEVMQQATVHTSFAEAVADCSVIYGTTAVGDRRLEHSVEPLPQAGQAIHASLSSGNRAAIVFGSEKTGMTNEQISFCSGLLTIPMEVHGTSMNLGQSVAVCLWELVREQAQGKPLQEEDALADSGSVDRFEATLREGLTATGYEAKFPANCNPEMTRRLVRRLRLTKKDAEIWTGIWRQVLWKLRQ
ncbi:RNA methyltransferase [Terriglobus tenax]|uniref:RNA methyltransferase n=1 Tax=Terriglobus tenax TaxID=1111115 RepID=UPI0021DF8747|nr:RNA methyltransferase [Terriglobus tenax]